MTSAKQIGEHFEVIGADGAHVGTVDRVEDDRIKLTKNDNGQTQGEHRYIPLGFVADIEGEKVRLSANADVAVSMEEAR